MDVVLGTYNVDRHDSYRRTAGLDSYLNRLDENLVKHFGHLTTCAPAIEDASDKVRVDSENRKYFRRDLKLMTRTPVMAYGPTEGQARWMCRA